jgi:hypothetical protein
MDTEHINIIASRLQNLESLKLYFPNQCSRSVDISALAKLEYLEELSLLRFFESENMVVEGMNRQTNISFRRSQFKFNRLSRFHVKNLYISAHDLQNIIADSPTGVHLNLTLVDLTDLHIQGSQNLLSLTLDSMSFLSSIYLSDCPSLQQVTLHECQEISCLHMQSLPSVKKVSAPMNLYALEYLFIECCNLEFLDIFFRNDFAASNEFLEWWKCIYTPMLRTLFAVVGDTLHRELSQSAISYLKQECPLLTHVHTQYPQQYK